MLTDRTAALLDHGLAALRAAQLLGELGHADDGEHVPEPGEVSGRYLARCCGVSLRTIQNFERGLMQRIASQLIDSGVPANVAAVLLDHIDNQPNP